MKQPKNKMKPPVKPLYKRYPDGSPIGKPDMHNVLFPAALFTVLTGVAILIIYVVVVKGPDNHSSLWNSARAFSRTQVTFVPTSPVPQLTLVPPAPTPAPGATLQPTPAPTVPAQVSFSQDVLPIFKASCFNCHGATVSIMGINLSSYSAIIDTKAHPQLFVPGKPEESLLMNALRGSNGVQMPPSGTLPADKIAIVQQWITLGGLNN